MRWTRRPQPRVHVRMTGMSSGPGSCRGHPPSHPWSFSGLMGVQGTEWAFGDLAMEHLSHSQLSCPRKAQTAALGMRQLRASASRDPLLGLLTISKGSGNKLSCVFMTLFSLSPFPPSSWSTSSSLHLVFKMKGTVAVELLANAGVPTRPQNPTRVHTRGHRARGPSRILASALLV